MAQVKTDNTVSSLRGRFGGVYFKTGDSQHIQKMPRHVLYAKSGPQKTGINEFSANASIWGLVLFVFHAAAWMTFAAANWFVSKRRPEPHKISGYNWYMYYAMMFPEEQRPPFWKPPHSQGDLPSYIITSGDRRFYYQTPDQFDLDRPCNYFWEFMPINGKMSFKDDENRWYLWWKDPEWCVSLDAGAVTPLKTFYSPTPDIKGWYRNPDDGKRCHVYPGKKDLVPP